MLSESREARIKKSTFTLTGCTPWNVDLTTTFVDQDEPIHTHAIFGLEGDVLRYCVGPPGQARPTEFATRAGDRLTLVHSQRRF
jgi:uncharacterized protein (TIGR03067 family)